MYLRRIETDEHERTQQNIDVLPRRTGGGRGNEHDRDRSEGGKSRTPVEEREAGGDQIESADGRDENGWFRYTERREELDRRLVGDELARAGDE